jgi:hypothetical protein
VRSVCRAVLKEEQCPIQADGATALVTPLVEDVGFSWRLTVDLRPGAGFVTVDPSLEIHRSSDYEPPRRSGKPALSPYDEPSTRGAARDGSINERQTAPRTTGDPMADREGRIREVERRVNRFVDAVAARLSAK